MMRAVEGPTGCWTMVDPQGRVDGVIELMKVQGGTLARYKARQFELRVSSRSAQ